MKSEWTIPRDAMTEAGLTDDEAKRVICELARDYDPVYAAAPDLLAACRDAAEMLRIARRYFPKSIKNSDTFRLLNVEANSIQKAIALAEGV